MATAFLIVGFLLAVVGLALWSLPLALVVAGAVLFVSGGLELARDRTPPRRGTT